MRSAWRLYARLWTFFFLILLGVSGCHSETPLPTGQGTPVGQGAPRYAGFSVMGPDWQVAESFANKNERLAYLEEQGYLMARHTSRLHGNMVRVPIYMWTVLGSGLPSVTASTRKPLYQIDTDTVAATIEKISAFLRAGPGRNGKRSRRNWPAFAVATVGRPPGRHPKIQCRVGGRSDEYTSSRPGHHSFNFLPAGGDHRVPQGGGGPGGSTRRHIFVLSVSWCSATAMAIQETGRPPCSRLLRRLR